MVLDRCPADRGSRSCPGTARSGRVAARLRSLRRAPARGPLPRLPSRTETQGWARPDESSRSAERRQERPGDRPGRNPGDSLLWQRIESDEMPPKHAARREPEKKILRDWIAAGAAWGTDPIDPYRFTTGSRAGRDWWSLRPVRPAELPAVQRPGLGTESRSTASCSRRLECEGAEARRPRRTARTLIRRLSFDLTGPAADARGGRGVRRTTTIPVAYENARRPAARLAPLRRALGAALARRRPVRRERRLRARRAAAERLALPRLGDPGAQRATCPTTEFVRAPARRRRAATRTTPTAVDATGLPRRRASTTPSWPGTDARP